VELAGQVASTHRTDPTLVFSEEKHREIVRRARSRKRLIISGIALLLSVVAISITLNLMAARRERIAKAMAREEAAWRDLKMLSSALERFRGDVSRYPTNEEGLLGLSRRPAAFPADSVDHLVYWFGPYIENIPEVDPWGNDYIYATSDGGANFELFSYGPGGETGSDSRFRVASNTSTVSNR